MVVDGVRSNCHGLLLDHSKGEFEPMIAELYADELHLTLPSGFR
jgi:hypothetical protein